MPSNVPLSNQPTCLHIPIQPTTNPNNKGTHQVDILNLPLYSISTAELYEMNLRSGQTVNVLPPPVIIEQLDTEGKELEPINKEPKQTDRSQAPPVKQN